MNKKVSFVLLSILVMVSLMMSLMSPTLVLANNSAIKHVDAGLNPIVTDASFHDLSEPLSSFGVTSPDRPTQAFKETPRFDLQKGIMPAEKALSGDQAIQNSPVASQMPVVNANFDGINNIAGVAPPDTQGDVGYDAATGKKYYMQWVNLHIQVWDVTDPANPIAKFAAPIAGNNIWSGFGGRCAADNNGDPIVLFDELAGRWFISQFSVTSAPYFNCIAVSQTGDPTGAYYRYAFQWSATKMNDYPKYGIWPDGYYMTVNQFDSGSNWAGAGVAVYERDQMLVGGAARQVSFDLLAANSAFGGMLPADFEGTPPPAGTPNIFAEVDDSTSLGDAADTMRLWDFHVDWNTIGNSTFGLNGQPNQLLPVTNFNILCSSGTRDCIPQPGTTQKVDGIGDRLMYRLAYRYFPETGKQVLAVNHTVNVASTGDRAGIRWYQLEKTTGNWVIVHQSTYAGDTPGTDTINRWMGSIAIDSVGNLALGYSMSNASVYPSLGIVGRLASDPVNTLGQGELVAFSGSASQTGVNRWGDYSSMSVDPTDGCTFWYTNEYSTGGWNWKTRIVSFKYPNCTLGPVGTLSGKVVDSVSLAPIAGAKVSANNLYNTTTNSTGDYTFTLPVGDYGITATAYAYAPGAVSGIPVVENATTTQNFNLVHAVMIPVSGVISDGTPGGHTWPLYARIDINGYPGSPIYSQVTDGFYTVNLPANTVTDFKVTALLPGYQMLTTSVTVPASGTLTKNFSLLASQSSCNAPGYSPSVVTILTQNFDTVTPPAIPANWSVTLVSGTTANWLTNVGTKHPTGIGSNSSPNLIYFNSYTVGSGQQSRLHYTTPLLLSTNMIFSFWMYHDTGYSSYNDSIQVQVSTNGGTVWQNVGTVFTRPQASASWQKHTVDLSAFAGQSIRLGLLATSAYGNDIHIDDISIASSTCLIVSGGLVRGVVTDQNTGLSLPGAGISTAAGSTTTGQILGIGDSAYFVFAPAGTNVPVTATKVAYQSVTQPLASVVNNATYVLNFAMPAGKLSDPAAINITLPMNSTNTTTTSLNNNGGASVDFAVTEVNAPVRTLAPNPIQAASGRHVSPKRLNDLTVPSGYPVQSLWRSAPIVMPNAGAVLSSFNSHLVAPWGIGYDLLNDKIWLGSIKAGAGDDLDHEFTLAGAATGRTMDTTAWVGSWAADMTFDPSTGKFWQVNVGGDNCVYQLNPDTGLSTGNKICPLFGTSERGLAYDPLTDTFFTGSWNDTIIRRFDKAGTILEAVNVNINIAGLAYNPSTGHLFVTQSGGAPDIFVLDTANNFAQVGTFDVTGLANDAGLEIGCDGHLWAPDFTSGMVYEVDSGETGVCDWMNIPWLTETNSAGTITAGGSQEMSLSFDTTGMMPGTYPAQLRISHNTPYGVNPIPVNLTVTLGTGFGLLQGTLTGLLPCDQTPAVPLNGATVEIYQGANLVKTLTTDASGNFTWVFPAGNYTVKSSVTGYIPDSTDVTVTSLQNTTQNIVLRADKPCVSTEPTSLFAGLPPDSQKLVSLTLHNSGAADAQYTLSEQSGSITLPNEGFEGATFPPDGWTQQISIPGYTWGSSTMTPHSGTKKADILYEPTPLQQNEWLLTPEYSLSSGSLSLWSSGSVYWCKTTYDNCDLNVWMVKGSVGGGDDILLGKADDAWTANWTYAQSTFNLTPYLDPSGTLFRIGFQYLGKDGAEISLDDVVMTGVPMVDIPWLSETSTVGTISKDTGTKLIAVTFDSSGMPAGTYQTKLIITDQFKRSMEVPVTLLVDNPPVSVLDSYVALTNHTLSVDATKGVLANDTDVNGDPLTAILVSGPSHGALTLRPDGSFDYVPTANYQGADSFTYKANDGTLDGNSVTVDILVVFIPITGGYSLFLPTLGK